MSASVLKTIAMLTVLASLTAVGYAFGSRPLSPVDLPDEGSCCASAGSCHSESGGCCASESKTACAS